LNLIENKKKTYLKKNGLVPIGGKGAKFQPIQKKLFEENPRKTPGKDIIGQ